MASKNDFKKFNIGYLDEIMKENKLTQYQLSEAIGMEKSYISYRKKEGTMLDSHIRLICALYKADYQKLITPQVITPTVIETATTPDATITFILNSLNKLTERISALENQKPPVEVTDKEQIVLLLQQMTKFGQCEESQFKSKAKSYGFSPELIQFAIDSLKCKRDVTAGKVWLVRK
jgi:transcriptional regulator with XRE-family HTH domain